MAFHRWLYHDGHPNLLAKILNSGWAFLHSLGIAPNYMVTLDAVGRQSGRLISFPLAMALVNGERYLVSMLGGEANWVRNVRAAGGKAQLRHGQTERVILREVEVGQRAPILKEYLRRAPGARPHISIALDAPLSEYEKISAQFPVFRVENV